MKEHALSLLHTQMRHRVLKRFGSPSLAEIGLMAPHDIETSPAALLQHLFPGADLGPLEQEFDEVHAELELRRTDPEHVVYQREFDVEKGTAFVLYAATRLSRPAHILETGVANGESTYFFLAALRKNDSGVLHSVDIRANVGSRLTAAEREGWDLIVLNRANAAADFKRRVAALPAIDFFLHDSLHVYSHMRMEMEAAWRKMNSGGIFACDDADSTVAFFEFAGEHELDYRLLFDARKLMGVARVMTASPTSS